jgi:hypothetical protein
MIHDDHHGHGAPLVACRVSTRSNISNEPNPVLIGIKLVDEIYGRAIGSNALRPSFVLFDRDHSQFSINEVSIDTEVRNARIPVPERNIIESSLDRELSNVCHPPVAVDSDVLRETATISEHREDSGRTSDIHDYDFIGCAEMISKTLARLMVEGVSELKQVVAGIRAGIGDAFREICLGTDDTLVACPRWERI